MKTATKLTGLALAAAAASLFATAGIGTAYGADEAKVQCTGGNECKGKSECKSASNECKGQNACKGKGFVTTKSQKACDELKAKMKTG